MAGEAASRHGNEAIWFPKIRTVATSCVGSLCRAIFTDETSGYTYEATETANGWVELYRTGTNPGRPSLQKTFMMTLPSIALSPEGWAAVLIAYDAGQKAGYSVGEANLRGKMRSLLGF